MQRVIATMSCVLLLSGCGSRVSVEGPKLEPAAAAAASSPVPEPTALPSTVAAVPTPTAVPSPVPVPQPAPVAATPVPQPASAAHPSPSPTPLALPWGEWVLDMSSIGMTAGDEDVEVTLIILEESDRLIARGHSGCNGYGSEVALDGGEWRFTGDGLTSSGMGCPPEQMAVEDAYMGRFGDVTRWSMTDGVLLLADDSVTLLRFTSAG